MVSQQNEKSTQSSRKVAIKYKLKFPHINCPEEYIGEF